MVTKRKVRNRLYKFRAFGERTLEALISDKVFFSDPSTFNDPLDTKPCLETNLGADELANILRQLVQQRVSSEMGATAEAFRARGRKALDHIAAHSLRRAEQVIAEIRYDATNPEYEIDQPELYLFGQYIEQELLQRYDKGIVALAENSNCPLMWGH